MVDTISVSTSDWFNHRKHLLSGSFPSVIVPPPRAFDGIIISVDRNYEDDLEDALIAKEASESYEKYGIDDATSYADYRANRLG